MDAKTLVSSLLQSVSSTQGQKLAADTQTKIQDIMNFHDTHPVLHSNDPLNPGVEQSKHQKWCHDLYKVLLDAGVPPTEDISPQAISKLSPGALEKIHADIDPKFFKNHKGAKQAGVLTLEEIPNTNLDIQEMVGDPADTAISTFSQFKAQPGMAQMPNPMSPVQGDEMFFTYLIPGARFQANDGSWWDIESYGWDGQIEVSNTWYPRLHAHISLTDLRRSIHSWIEPIQQVIPPVPAGVDYGTIDVHTV